MRSPDKPKIKTARANGLVALVLAAAMLLNSCATQPTPMQCAEVADAGASLDCLNDSMFGVGQGAAMGAVTGALLGGAVAFAASGGRSYGALVKGVLIGGMVGGVAGGLVAYLHDLDARTNYSIARSAEQNEANRRAFEENLSLIEQKYWQLHHETEDEFEAINDGIETIERNSATTRADVERLQSRVAQLSRRLYSAEMLIPNAAQAERVLSEAAGHYGSPVDDILHKRIAALEADLARKVEHLKRDDEIIRQYLHNSHPS